MIFTAVWLERDRFMFLRVFETLWLRSGAPHSREVLAFTPDGLSRTFNENDVLQDERVLLGFRCAVAELFR